MLVVTELPGFDKSKNVTKFTRFSVALATVIVSRVPVVPCLGLTLNMFAEEADLNACGLSFEAVPLTSTRNLPDGFSFNVFSYNLTVI